MYLKGAENSVMILWLIATFSAYFVKGLCGFANGLIFTTILGFGASNTSISPVNLLLGYPANLILTWKTRRNLDRKVWLPLSILVLAGSIPGALLLKSVDERTTKLVFGIVIIALGTEMLVREFCQKRARSSKLVLAVIGVTGGMLCGLYGVGALLAAYVSRVTKNDGSFKANISAVFVVDNTFRIILYKTLGLLTLRTIKTFLLLIPFALIGLLTGMKCSESMNENKIRRITTVFLILSGISLVLKNL